MLEALLEHLLEKPDLYQDEMAVFLYDEFHVLVTIPTISRASGVGPLCPRKRPPALSRSETQTYEIFTSPAVRIPILPASYT
jgi:hypothetical protein